jgi:hypothetical protein
MLKVVIHLKSGKKLELSSEEMCELEDEIKNIRQEIEFIPVLFNPEIIRDPYVYCGAESTEVYS